MTISIITINYNNASGLEKTILSVITQTAVDNIEYIVIDGDSTDGSKDVVQKYKRHFAYSVSEPDKGIYNAMNKGTSHANGDFLLFLNSGDCLSSPAIISKVVSFIRKETTNINNSVFIGSVNLVESTGKIIGCRSADLELISSPYCMLFASIPHQAAFIPKDLMLSHPYDEDIRIISDWKFFLDAITLGETNVNNIPYTIADYDVTGISSYGYGQQLEDREKVLLSMLPRNIAQDYKKVAPLKSDYYKIRWMMNHKLFMKSLLLLVGVIMRFTRR